MRYFYSLVFVLLSVCFFTSLNAIPQLRHKRWVAREHCPENMTNKQCEDYAKEEVKGTCQTYGVSDGEISYLGCGLVLCEEPLKVVTDISKPHPECCPRCSL